MSNLANREIREAAKSKNLHLWQVAEGVGLSESYFSRKMRRELPQQEKESILNLIDNLAAENAGVS